MEFAIYEALTYLLENFVNVQLGFDAALLGVIFFLVRKYFAFRRMVQKMTITSKTVPVDSTQLTAWKNTLAGLPAGSAKRGAYIAAIRAAEVEAEALRSKTAATTAAKGREEDARKALETAQKQYDEITNGD